MQTKMKTARKENSMARNRQKSPITNVLFSYVGTDAQFDEFLKLMLHDYLAADNPYANRHQDFC